VKRRKGENECRKAGRDGKDAQRMTGDTMLIRSSYDTAAKGDPSNVASLQCFGFLDSPAPRTQEKTGAEERCAVSVWSGNPRPGSRGYVMNTNYKFRFFLEIIVSIREKESI
jgi:hypothetical protein